MNKREITEILSLFVLAYPGTKVFEGGIPKLEPMINLWHISLLDIPYSLAKDAALQICRESKFPPTIAEFRAKAEEVRKSIHYEVLEGVLFIRDRLLDHTPEEVLAQLAPGSPMRVVIEAMGGPARLIDRNGRFNYLEFSDNYERLLCTQKAGGSPAILLDKSK